VRLTDEQLAIVRHDLSSHAKVLAVAGSGKTSTMRRPLEATGREAMPAIGTSQDGDRDL
jgi:hypothetical protein